MPKFLARHQCRAANKEVDQSDFVTSLLVAEATDSALLGTMVGGNFLAAEIGQALADTTPEPDLSPPTDFSGGGGSSDGGGSGGDWSQ